MSIKHLENKVSGYITSNSCFYPEQIIIKLSQKNDKSILSLKSDNIQLSVNLDDIFYMLKEIEEC